VQIFCVSPLSLKKVLKLIHPILRVMSSSKKTNIIHPYIYFLIEDGFSSIFDQLKARQTPMALRELYWLTSFLDSGGQEKLKTTIKEMETLLENVNSISQESFRKVLSQVVIYLHSQGYFLQAKYEVPTRATGLKSLADKLGGEEKE